MAELQKPALELQRFDGIPVWTDEALFAAFTGNFAPLASLWVFILGPMIGAALAALCYNILADR